MAASATHLNAPLSQQRAMNDTLIRLAHFCYVCSVAADRSGWRAATKSGVAHHEAKLRERNDAARQACHRQRDLATDFTPGLPCPRCIRTFGTAAGLASQGRAYQRRLMEERRHRIDGPP